MQFLHTGKITLSKTEILQLAKIAETGLAALKYADIKEGESLAKAVIAFEKAIEKHNDTLVNGEDASNDNT